MGSGGRPWTEDDDLQLVALGRGRAPVDEMAAALGRSRRAITERLRAYVPDAPARGRWDAFVALAADPGFDAAAALDRYYRRRGIARWTSAREERVVAAWRAGGVALAAVAEQVGLSETHVADWLVSRGHAGTVAEVAGRLAPTPGGAVDQRARLAAGRLAETVWVVSVFAVDGSGAAVWVHADKEAAGQALVAAVSPTAGDGLVAVRWMIAPRTLRPSRKVAAAGTGWVQPGALSALSRT